MKKVLLLALLLIAFFKVYSQDPLGQTVIGFIAPTDSLDDYYTHDDYFGKVGFRIVKTILQRDLLPQSRRQEGMKVYVQEDNKIYKLLDCIGNNCWVLDRIDTLWNGTFSNGKITVQPIADGSTFLYDAYNYQGYQRFGITKNGLLIAGRRMPLYINVDALVWLGDRNELLATDGMVIGKDNIVNGDTAAAFGYNLESNKYNSLLIGRGANRSNRVKSRWMRSVNIGAFQNIPQIELTEDTVRINSTVLLWNDEPFGGGGEITETDPVFSTSPSFNITSTNISNWNSLIGHTHSNYLPIYMGSTDPTGSTRYNLDGQLYSTGFYAPFSLISSTANGSVQLGGSDYVVKINTGLTSGGLKSYSYNSYGGNIESYQGRSALRVKGYWSTYALWVHSDGGIGMRVNNSNNSSWPIFQAQRDSVSVNEIWPSGLVKQKWGNDVVAANEITASGPIFKVTGTTTINTISYTSYGSTFSGEIKIIFVDSAPLGTTGNIMTALTPVANRVYSLVFNPNNYKWYVSN